MRYLYNFFFYLLIPFILIRLLWRSRKNKQYRLRLRERFGFIRVPKTYQNGIWIHSVSVGETVVAASLVQKLQKEMPGIPIIITTMTITGSERVRALLGALVYHVYVPYDLPGAVNRFLKRAKPRIVLLMETELWPNLLYCSSRKKIPVLLANARLSEKSAQGYRRFFWFTHTMFERIALIAAQSSEDADRFEQLQVPKEKIKVAGSIKFDLVLPPSIKEGAEHLRQQIGAYRPVWIAASTREGEEERILEAFSLVKKQLPNCLLILAPRHPERFEKVRDMCRDRLYHVVSRSSKHTCAENTDILLGDTMGELMLFYGASDVAFVGGSLLPYGGQNMLEPALFGLAIITGRHLFNFSEAARLLQDAQALIIADTATALADNVVQFLQDTELRKATGDRALKVVEENRGAVDRHLLLIRKLITH